MADIIIYHNGECSKCRGALEILQERKIPHEVRWYLADPLTKEEIIALLQKLSLNVSDIVRRSESLFTEQYEGREITDDEWLDILVENPILIQRPIVEKGDMAIIARPPGRIFEIIG